MTSIEKSLLICSKNLFSVVIKLSIWCLLKCHRKKDLHYIVSNHFPNLEFFVHDTSQWIFRKKTICIFRNNINIDKKKKKYSKGVKYN